MLLRPRKGWDLTSSLRGCQGFDLGTKHRWHAEDDRLAS